MVPVLLDQLLVLLKADGAALGLRRPISGETVNELGRAGLLSSTGLHIPAGEGINGHVMATGESYLNNIWPELRLYRLDLLDDIRALVCVPLIVQAQTTNVL